jgi:hypothetical protein
MTEQLQQPEGRRIKVVDPDDDYLAVDIQAANRRFAGTAPIYAGLDELSKFANQIRGFPANIQDERMYEFGSPAPSVAGGYCRLRFQCDDHAGHVLIAIVVENDDDRYRPGKSKLNFRAEPAAIDRFVERLREVELERSGEAVLTAVARTAKGRGKQLSPGQTLLAGSDPGMYDRL